MTPNAFKKTTLTPTEASWDIPLSDVLIDPALQEAVRETVESGWWSMGPRVAEFEAAFAAFCGTDHAFAVANGTAALHLALLAADCGPGDEVVLPSLNFVAAANVAVQIGATPVFCDIGGGTDLNLDPDDVRAAIGPSTKAIIALHYGGLPCAIDELRTLADEAGVALIEDAAHAPGAAVDGRPMGSIGDLGCFSFFANKNMPVGEGGMIVTNDTNLADRVRLLRSHGMTTLTWDRARGHAHSYDVVLAGFNYRLDELRAAMALVQLERLPAENDSRARIVERYRRSLSPHGVELLPQAAAEGTVAAHHLAVAMLPAGVAQQHVRAALQARRIQTSFHYPPIHTFSAYREHARRPLPRTEESAQRLVTLPLFGHMSDEATERVAMAVVEAVRSEPAHDA
jgi:dTDP-4-amino-4,6-dideoxygalactose transaminase